MRYLSPKEFNFLTSETIVEKQKRMKSCCQTSCLSCHQNSLDKCNLNCFFKKHPVQIVIMHITLFLIQEKVYYDSFFFGKKLNQHFNLYCTEMYNELYIQHRKCCASLQFIIKEVNQFFLQKIWIDFPGEFCSCIHSMNPYVLNYFKVC